METQIDEAGKEAFKVLNQLLNKKLDIMENYFKYLNVLTKV